MYRLAFILTVVVIGLIICFSAGSAACVCRKQGKVLNPVVKLPKPSHMQRLLFEFPYQLVTDMYNRQADEFQDCGFHLIVGEQGSGKTITLVYMLMQYQRRYNRLKVRTNMSYVYENGAINSWRDLVFRNNGVFGEIDVLDEVQNWFNSMQSRSFPPEMLAEISQQRKQRKMIFGTSQVWARVAKPIREQVQLVYKPMTLFGCLTVVFKYKPIVNSEGQADELKYRGAFYFVHNEQIRNAYDTYKKIAYMSADGFKDEKNQIRNGAKAQGD